MPKPQQVMRKIRQFVDDYDEYDKDSVQQVSDWELSEQDRLNKIDLLSGVYQLADRVLTNSDLEVVLVTDPSKNAPAWSDGSAIYLNVPKLEIPNDSGLISLHGLNYHELSHIIWTPRAGSELVKKVQDKQLLVAFNMLEDMRIESLMSVKYSATIPYLISTFLEYVLKQGGIENAYPLSRGRKFLPLHHRQMIADIFVHKHGLELTKALAKVIDQYRTLILPRDAKLALELITEYASLLGIFGNTSFTVTTGTCGNREPMTSGRMSPTKSQESLIGNLVNSDKVNGEENLTEPSPDKPKLDSDEIADKINQLIKELADNKQVRDDIKRVRNSLKEGGDTITTIKQIGYVEKTVLSSDSIASTRFAEELSQLRIDSDPSWEYETCSGKLNIQRAMNFDVTEINSLFDRWHEGSDSFDIEAIILTDNSGSMAGDDMSNTLRATWVIKRALESIESDVSSYTFNRNSHVLFNKSEKASPNTYRAVEAKGSTNPTGALHEAERIFMSSQRRTKILFILTDGEWDQSNTPNRAIERMNLAGVITVVVLIGDQQNFSTASIERYRHKAQIFHFVDQPRQVIGVARELVNSLNKKGK